MKSWPIRRSDTSRACAFSAAVTVLAPRVRPGRVFSGFVSGDAKVFSILPGEGWHGGVRARGGTKVALRGLVGSDRNVSSMPRGGGGHGDVGARGETILLRLPQCEATTL